MLLTLNLIGYNLPAKYILHSVGPAGEKPDLLRNCYETALNLAKQNELKTIVCILKKLQKKF